LPGQQQLPSTGKNVKSQKKPILMGDPEESPPPLCATIQIREFLGAVDFHQIWIPNYSLLAKPLYKATKGGEQEHVVWGEKQKKRPLRKFRGHS
jgi:hypothetical protein